MALTPRHAGVLLVDHDLDGLTRLAGLLIEDGFRVTTADDGLSAIRRLEEGWPDVLITALRLPGMDGLTLARRVKERADIPIIILSSIDSGERKAEALEAVADDYVTKPFHYPELRARINRVLNRVGGRPPSGLARLGPNLTLELHRHRATGARGPVDLTPFESRLLYVLAGSLDIVVPTDVILARGWADAESPDASSVWATMGRLRQKLELDPDNPVHIETVRGVGYRLNRLAEA